VFLCGPDTMVRALQAQLRAEGVPAGHIHREYFDWR
jgi:ferredoxin-NADP reductase